MKPVTVLICDDNRSVRTTLARALQLKEGIEVLAEVESFEQLEQQLDDRKPDVILLDVNMAGVSGVEGIKSLRAAGISTPIVVMSADSRNQKPALDAGASAFFYKGSSDLKQLVSDLHHCANAPGES